MKILTIPHKMLYQKADPVGRIDAEIQGIIDRMFLTMYEHKGIGLAAPQVGIPLQIVVINIKWLAKVLINPVTYRIDSELIPDMEYCLSIPGYSRLIERPEETYVLSRNRHNQKQNFRASNPLARVIQHEVDHLHGILINEK